ncbi:MAG: GTP 3',8-cyclase MoaA [Candidatus Aureabacteria bacterium]|nr:GTP 3',8-cyclase MoaA [Candidatus Auribacterota bacterium]
MANQSTNALRDHYNRAVDYLRISVTDRCNLRCFYCMPESGVQMMSHEDILRYEEILEVVDAASSLGFTRFRITGGEPLVRRGVLWLLEKLSERGVNYSITTNGILLRQYASDLRRAGLRRINIGLDTLDRKTFHRITRQDALPDVFRGIDAVRGMGLDSIKINVVVMKTVNEHEIDGFMEWGRRENLDIRFIEYMPVCGGDLFVPLTPLIRAREERGDFVELKERGGGPARNFRYKGADTTVGFILPRSRPFCATCNRLRFTADGTLLPCLFSRSGVDLRDSLRRGAPVEPLIRRAIEDKPRGHELNMKLHRYAMHALGG